MTNFLRSFCLPFKSFVMYQGACCLLQNDVYIAVLLTTLRPNHAANLTCFVVVFRLSVIKKQAVVQRCVRCQIEQIKTGNAAMQRQNMRTWSLFRLTGRCCCRQNLFCSRGLHSLLVNGKLACGQGGNEHA